jgi:hypothetical protein
MTIASAKMKQRIAEPPSTDLWHINPMPTIDFTDDEFAAVTAAVRRTIDEDRFPHSPRLGPLRAALAKLDPGSVPRPLPERKPLPEAPMRSRGGRRARR